MNFDYKRALNGAVLPIYREHIPGTALDLYQQIRPTTGVWGRLLNLSEYAQPAEVLP